MLQPQVIAETYVPPAHCVTLTRYFYPPSERSDVVLARQLHRAEKVVSQVIVRSLQAHQREALLCLVSDVVAGLAAAPVRFEKSFLVSAINKGMFQIASAEFHVFCYADGKVQTRLWEKRRAERYLFERGELLF
jgi:GH24 family phage-related lysozyme (muramidase)